MNKNWVLFGFSNALSDVLDAIYSQNDKLKKIVLNTEVNRKDLDYNLSFLKEKIEVIHLRDFKPDIDELYQFGFFIPEKKYLVERLTKEFELHYSNLFHQSSSISDFSRIGQGVVVGAQSVITAYSKLGDHVRINRLVSIGHHTEISEYTHVSPGATVAGCCRIGTGCFIGAGAVIKDRIIIGNNSIVGAGSVVVKNIPENVIVMGNPARVYKENHPVNLI